MAALDFPTAPSLGQIFYAGNSVVYEWTGTLWKATGSTAAGGASILLGSTSFASGSIHDATWLWPSGYVPIDVDFNATVSGASTIALNMMRAGVVIGSASYDLLASYNSSAGPTTFGGSSVAGQTSWNLTSHLGAMGTLSIRSISNVAVQGILRYMETQATLIGNVSAVVRMFVTDGGVIDGVRIATTGTFTSGYLRVWLR